jgi:predicted DNA-binding transcriptional regulator AlpA
MIAPKSLSVPSATRPRTSRQVPRPTSPPAAGLVRLAYRLDEVAESLGVSRRTLERERSAGRFPPPDAKIGKAPLWRPESIECWLTEGGGRGFIRLASQSELVGRSAR